jgi:N-acetyl-beta-hexosaminidase
MLDVSRHFIPMEKVLPIIDAMFAAKMNVFHFHLTDSPSVPFPSKLYPHLASEGSWAHDGGSGSEVSHGSNLAHVLNLNLTSLPLLL